MLPALFLIFFVSAVVPFPPEIFSTLFYMGNPGVLSAFLILVVAMVGSVLGNATVYYFFRIFGIPKFLNYLAEKYTNFLFIKGEKIVLISYIIPVIVLCGMFMMVCRWNLCRCLLYIAIGCLAKNTLLLILVAGFNYMYDQRMALILSFAALGVVLLLSYVFGRQFRTKLSTRSA